MGIVNGSCSFRRFFCSAKNIDPFDMEVDRAASRFAAPDIESMSDEKSLGWVTILHLLDRDLRVEKMLMGDWLCLVMRSDRRSVPETLVKAFMQLEVDGMTKGGKIRVSKAEREDLKDGIREKLMKMVLPRISGVDFAWNIKSGEVFLGSQTASACDTFVALFKQTFGLDLDHADVREIVRLKAGDEMLYKYTDLLPTNFVTAGEGEPDADGSALPLADEFIGREYLTWLWYALEKSGGEFELQDGTSIWFGIEDFLSFASGEKEGQRSILRNGAPSTSAEAVTALKAGRMLDKIRLTLSDGEDEWQFLLCADGVLPSSIKMPKGEERQPLGRCRERCESLSRLCRYLDGVFMSFLSVRLDEKQWKKERNGLVSWSKSR